MLIMYTMNNTNSTRKKDVLVLITVTVVSLIILIAFLIFVDKYQKEESQLTFIGIIKTILISMVPIVELRGAIPIAVASYNMSYASAFLFSYIGNCLVIVPVVLLTRTIFDWLKKNISFLRRIVEHLEKSITKKGNKALKYAELGLLLFVAIPCPGTGAWTGSMIAGLMDIRLRDAVPIISVGVLIAGIIVMFVTNAASWVL